MKPTMAVQQKHHHDNHQQQQQQNLYEQDPYVDEKELQAYQQQQYYQQQAYEFLLRYNTNKKHPSVDTVLAEELNRLSVEERETIYEEIHGVEKGIDETPDLISSSLDAMDKALRRIRHKPAYDLAEQMSPAYANDSKLRLGFLRSELFHPENAAIRFVNFFQGKLRYFGQHTLTRPLFISDLDPDTKLALESGCFQWLPSRDRSGRAVFLDLQNMVPRTWERGVSLLKASIYFFLSALEDEETQRRGVVGLVYHMGSNVVIDKELLTEAPIAMKFLPYKLTSAHLCFSNQFLNTYASALLSIVGGDFRARSRLHHGSHTECQYNLMAYGLPMDLFPVSVDGEVKKTNLKRWIAKRLRKENHLKQQYHNQYIAKSRGESLASSTSAVTATTTATATTTTPFEEFHFIDMPGRYDVLIGKGKPFQHHIGNIRLRTLVESYLKQYVATPKGEKYVVTGMIRDFIRQDGGRFLRKEKDDWWKEVTDTEALDKIGKLFLSVRASKNKSCSILNGADGSSSSAITSNSNNQHTPATVISSNNNHAMLEEEESEKMALLSNSIFTPKTLLRRYDIPLQPLRHHAGPVEKKARHAGIFQPCCRSDNDDTTIQITM